jgi:hypothetical protein
MLTPFKSWKSHGSLGTWLIICLSRLPPAKSTPARRWRKTRYRLNFLNIRFLQSSSANVVETLKGQ